MAGISRRPSPSHGRRRLPAERVPLARTGRRRDTDAVLIRPLADGGAPQFIVSTHSWRVARRRGRGDSAHNGTGLSRGTQPRSC